ncbi:MAG TPA: hypothetical protein DEP84_25480 [Chloroflexi bacterium]|nr:hypothetical protein [Chloroflexota bacterium]
MRRSLALGLLSLLVVLFVAGCGVVPGRSGSVYIGGDSTVRRGQTIDEPVTVLGGNVTLKEGSRLASDLFVIGANVNAYGEIDRDVHVYGGNLTLGSSAVVHGGVFTLGGNVSRNPGARIEGQVSSGEGIAIPPVLPFPGRFSLAGQVFWFLFRTVALAALAIVVVALWPQHAARTARAIVDQPVTAGLLGLLTYIGVPVLLILLAITIILIPVSLLVGVLLVVAALFGWIAFGLEVGQRLVRAFDWHLKPAVAAGVGTLAFTFVVDGVGLIPCVGWVAPLLASSIGLGGVLLTRFGTRTYIPSTGAVLPPAAPGERSAAT